MSGRDGRRVKLAGVVRAADNEAADVLDEDGEYEYGESVDDGALLMCGSMGASGDIGAADVNGGGGGILMLLLLGRRLTSLTAAGLADGSARADSEASDEEEDGAGKAGGVLAGEAE